MVLIVEDIALIIAATTSVVLLIILSYKKVRVHFNSSQCSRKDNVKKKKVFVHCLFAYCLCLFCH